MELDRTRIAIRERGYLDVLDLALCVFRAHAGPLSLTILAGSVPMFALNWWLLSDSITVEAFELDSSVIWRYCWQLLALTFLEMPLAAAPTTLFLGDALFLERPSGGQIVRNLLATLPQMALLQLIPRALVVLPAVLLEEPVLVGFAIMVLVLGVPLHYAVWPYLTEVILLERNPLVRRGARDKGTLARCGMLHGRYRIELFGQWIMALLFSSAWLAALWGGGWYLWINLVGKLELAGETFTILLPAAMWVVIGFFTIARYLGYLDLRIKTEGWEIELRMRAEAQRLTKAVIVALVCLSCLAVNRAAAQEATPSVKASAPSVEVETDVVEDAAAVESGRDALRGGWTGERYPWYDSGKDDLRRIKVQPPSDFWQRFWLWLQSFNIDLSFLGYSFTLFQVLAVLLIALLLGILIYILTKVYIRRQQLAVRAALEEAPAAVRVADIEALPPPVRQHVGELLARAMQLYQEGRYSEAIVYLFSHELLEMDKNQLIRLARGKTNRQYLGELRGRRPLREVVERTMVVFEDAFFGDYTIERDRFETCWSQLDAFNRLVRQGGT